MVADPVLSMGKITRELPPGKSIYEVIGRVLVDGVPATINTVIGANSIIETGSDGRLIFAVGKDAFVLRSDSQLILNGKNFLIDTLNLVSGKLLSVFGKTTHTATTTIATIGIRGTGVYLETDEEKTYVCTCYGTVDLRANDDVESRESVTTLYHDAPRYIYASGEAGQRIVPAPVINHSDLELVLIEELVGRAPPFGKRSKSY